MPSFDDLSQEEFILLTTFRKNGLAVPTPVWFVHLDGKLYVWTQDNSGKVKRIRNHSRVTIAASDARGAIHGHTFDGLALLLPDSAAAKAAFYKKYGLVKRMFEAVGGLRRASYIYIEISPA